MFTESPKMRKNKKTANDKRVWDVTKDVRKY